MDTGIFLLQKSCSKKTRAVIRAANHDNVYFSISSATSHHSFLHSFWLTVNGNGTLFGNKFQKDLFYLFAGIGSVFQININRCLFRCHEVFVELVLNLNGRDKT